MEAIDYAVPNTVEEAIEILSSKGEKARVLAGGTDLLVQLRGGRYSLDTVIDVKNIDALNTYTFDSSKGLEIGSAVELYRIYQDPELVEVFPGLMDAATLIGGIQIQGRATFGGNLCNSAPSGVLCWSWKKCYGQGRDIGVYFRSHPCEGVWFELPTFYPKK